MNVILPFGDTTIAAELPDDTRLLSSIERTAIEAYRHRFAFHPIHGILATHPLKRLRHVGRVIVAAPQDAHVPRHLGFEVAGSVEEAVARARHGHGPGATIAYVAHPPLTR